MSRPTSLQFRAPDERTAEFTNELQVNYEGKRIDTASGTRQNPKGTNLP